MKKKVWKVKGSDKNDNKGSGLVESKESLGMPQGQISPQKRRTDSMAEVGENGNVVTAVYYDSTTKVYYWACNNNKDAGSIKITQDFMRDIATWTKTLTINSEKDVEQLKTKIMEAIELTIGELEKVQKFPSSATYEENIRRDLYKIANSIIARRLIDSAEELGRSDDPRLVEARRVALSQEEVAALEGGRHIFIPGKQNEHAELKILLQLISNGQITQDHFVGISKKCCPDCTAWMESIQEAMGVNINVRAPTNKRVAFTSVVAPSFMGHKFTGDKLPESVTSFLKAKDNIQKLYSKKMAGFRRDLQKKPGELLRDMSPSPVTVEDTNRLHILDNFFQSKGESKGEEDKDAQPLDAPQLEETGYSLPKSNISVLFDREDNTLVFIDPKDNIVYPVHPGQYPYLVSKEQLIIHPQLKATNLFLPSSSPHLPPIQVFQDTLTKQYVYIDPNTHESFLVNSSQYPYLVSKGQLVLHPQLKATNLFLPSSSPYQPPIPVLWDSVNKNYVSTDGVKLYPVNRGQYPYLVSNGQLVLHPQLKATEFFLPSSSPYQSPIPVLWDSVNENYVSTDGIKLYLVHPSQYPYLVLERGQLVLHPQLKAIEFFLPSSSPYQSPIPVLFDNKSNIFVYIDPSSSKLFQVNPSQYPYLEDQSKTKIQYSEALDMMSGTKDKPESKGKGSKEGDGEGQEDEDKDKGKKGKSSSNLLGDWYSEDNIKTLLKAELNGIAEISPQTQLEHGGLLTDNLKEAIGRTITEGMPVVIPIHLHGNHWAGAIVRRQDDGSIQVIYNDPQGNGLEGEENAIKFVQAITGRAQELTGKAPNIIDLRLRQQKNGIDCGPFVVDNLVKLARAGGELDNLTQGEIIGLDLLETPIDGSAMHIRVNHNKLVTGESESKEFKEREVSGSIVQETAPSGSKSAKAIESKEKPGAEAMEGRQTKSGKPEITPEIQGVKSKDKPGIPPTPASLPPVDVPSEAVLSGAKPAAKSKISSDGSRSAAVLAKKPENKNNSAGKAIIGPHTRHAVKGKEGQSSQEHNPS